MSTKTPRQIAEEAQRKCEPDSWLNEFHRINTARQHEAFAPAHSLLGLVACVAEEVGELSGAALGVTREKKRKLGLTNDDMLDAVADAITYLSLIADRCGCSDLQKLLGDTFNMVSDRAGSKMKVSRAAHASERWTVEPSSGNSDWHWIIRESDSRRLFEVFGAKDADAAINAHNATLGASDDTNIDYINIGNLEPAHASDPQFFCDKCGYYGNSAKHDACSYLAEPVQKEAKVSPCCQSFVAKPVKRIKAYPILGKQKGGEKK